MIPLRKWFIPGPSNQLLLREKFSGFKSPPFLIGVITVLLVLRSLFIVRNYGVPVFNWDQWSFLQPIWDENGLWALFNFRMGGHAMGPGFWLIKFVLSLTHYNPLSIAYLNVFVLFLAAVSCIALIRSLCLELIWSDVVIPFLVLNLSQWAIYLATPNPSHGPLSLLFLILFLICLKFQKEQTRLVLCLVFGLFTVFSGYGLFLVFLLPFILGSSLFPKFRLIGLMSSLAIAFLFFRSNQGDWNPSCLSFLEANPFESIVFPSLIYGRSIGASRVLSIPSFAGLALFLMNIYIILKTLRQFWLKGKLEVFRWTILILSSFSFLFVIGLSKGRICMGRTFGLESRYVTYLIPFLICFYVEIRKRPVLRNAFIFFFIAFDVWPKSIDLRGMEFYKRGKSNWLKCYETTHDAAGCNREDIYIIYPDPIEGKIAEKMNRLQTYK